MPLSGLTAYWPWGWTLLIWVLVSSMVLLQNVQAEEADARDEGGKPCGRINRLNMFREINLRHGRKINFSFMCGKSHRPSDGVPESITCQDGQWMHDEQPIDINQKLGPGKICKLKECHVDPLWKTVLPGLNDTYVPITDIKLVCPPNFTLTDFFKTPDGKFTCLAGGVWSLNISDHGMICRALSAEEVIANEQADRNTSKPPTTQPRPEPPATTATTSESSPAQKPSKTSLDQGSASKSQLPPTSASGPKITEEMKGAKIYTGSTTFPPIPDAHPENAGNWDDVRERVHQGGGFKTVVRKMPEAAEKASDAEKIPASPDMDPEAESEESLLQGSSTTATVKTDVQKQKRPKLKDLLSKGDVPAPRGPARPSGQQRPPLDNDMERTKNDDGVVVMQSDMPPREVKLVQPIYEAVGGSKVVLKRCEEPVLSPHVSWLNPSPLFIGCTAVYACKAGYVFDDGRPFVLSTCGKDGTMTVRTLPGCKAITYCKAIATVPNTTLTPATGPYPVSQVAVHTCLDGHRFRDGTRMQAVQCQPDGTWDCTVEDGCYPVQCEPLTRPSNVSCVTIKQEVHSNVSFVNTGLECKCHTPGGRFIDGKEKKWPKCLSDGVWSQPLPQCDDPHLCYDPPEVPNAFILDEQHNRQRNSTIRYQCVEGFHWPYEAVTVMEAYCDATGWWTMPYAACVEDGSLEEGKQARSTSGGTHTVQRYPAFITLLTIIVLCLPSIN